MDELKEKLVSEFGIPENRLPNSVLHKCAEDPVFLANLLVCWKDDFMYDLLVKQIKSTITISDTEILKKSSKSIINWIKGGMKFSSDSTYQKRIKTCNICEHVSSPSDSILYKISHTEKICTLCGCDIKKKAKLLTEKCPDNLTVANGRWPE